MSGPAEALLQTQNELPSNSFTTSVGIRPVIHNTIATVNLGAKLNLKTIALGARNCEYNPKRFSAAIIRIRDPKTTALLFSTGKMVCTGAKSEDLAKKAARRYARIVKKLGFPVKFTDFKIQNIVAIADVKFPIRLDGLNTSDHGHFTSYEPELFSGLVYRFAAKNSGTTGVKGPVMLVFVSGKVVFTGAKERSQILDAFEQIYPILCQYKKDF